MKIEQIKSLILTGLVLLSIVLYGYVVTFQQNYDPLNKREYVVDINISDEEPKPMRDLISPNKLLFQQEGLFVGTEKMTDMQELMLEIKKWNFYDFALASNEFTELFNKGMSALIIQYPSPLPMALIKNLFTITEENLPSIRFQYLVTFTDEMNTTGAEVYFVSPDFKTAVKSRIKYDNFGRFSDQLERFLNEKAKPYLAFQKDNGSYLFVYQESIELTDEQYLPKEFNPEVFVEVLFPDPTIVTKNGSRYSNGSRFLDIYQDTKMLKYVNPTIVVERPIDGLTILQTGVNFINQHGGWTDNYYFSNLQSEKNNNEVSFQLYYQDYMVYNEQGLSNILIHIGDKGVESYRRPYFELDVSYNPIPSTYQLETGQEIYDYLVKIIQVDINNVEDISIGYSMKLREDVAMGEQLVILEPAWFYKINGTWRKINVDWEGGF